MRRSRKTSSRRLSMSESASPVRAVTAEVLRNDEIAERIHVVILSLKDSGRLPSPGQFYQVDCGGGREHILPRPIGVMDAGTDGERVTIAFLVEAVGWGTERICSLTAGDGLRMLGPLGNGFSDPGEETPLVVAGGAGLAPLHYLATTWDKEGRGYDLMVGVSTKSKHLPIVDTLRGEVEIFSDDGTIGNKGIVCNIARPRIDLGGYGKVYTCGPEPMMAVVAEAAEERGVPCEVSLDARMACGIGACRGCVKDGREGKVCVCTDGPVFDSRKVLFG